MNMDAQTFGGSGYAVNMVAVSMDPQTYGILDVLQATSIWMH